MNIININLPKIKNKEARINVVFDFGYINESDSKFGLTHLVEHYIVHGLQKEFNLKDVYGWVDNVNSGLEVVLKEKNVEEFLDKLSTGILVEISNNLDMDIVKNEIDRVEFELHDKYYNQQEKIYDKINNSFLKKDVRVLRNRLDQVNNLRKFTKKEIQNCIKKLDSVNRFVVVGYKNNREDYKKFRNKNRANWPITVKKGKKFKIKTDNKKVNNYLIGFITKFTNFSKEEDLIASVFVVNRVLDIFKEKIYSYGIYNINKFMSLEDKFSYVWFHASSTKNIDIKKLEQLIYESVEELFKKKDLKKILNDWNKDDIKFKSEDFNKTEDKMEWVTGDIINKGRVIDLEEIKESVGKIDVDKIRKISKDIFNRKGQFIVTD